MISNSYFSNWYIVYTVRSRTEEEKNENEDTYAEFQHVLTRGRKEKEVTLNSYFYY